ncbi:MULTISPECIES: hypothetical protein [unclassified Vibrio]|uniref:hypothetical protein n=1 Tax=unclassified Vibrio TaxID=2614977 RepID=UPI003CEBAE8A
MSDQSAKFVQGSTMRHILVMSGPAQASVFAQFTVLFFSILVKQRWGRCPLST